MVPCVGLNGSSLSEEQELLLREHFTGVLLLDGDEAGRTSMTDCLRRMGQRAWVKAAMLPEGKQPDDLSAGELAELLNGGRG